LAEAARKGDSTIAVERDRLAMTTPPEPPVSPSTDTTAAEAPSRTRRRWTFLWLILLLSIWGLIMLFRMEIRAQIWAYRLTQAQSREERRYFLACLTSIGNKSLGAAKRLIRSRRPEVRMMGITVLESCKGPEAEHLLIDLFRDRDDDVADDAALALAGRPGAIGYLPMLREMLDRHDQASRHAAVALLRMPGLEPEAILVKALSGTDDPDLRAQIIDTLGMRANRQAAPAIVAMIEDTRPVQHLPYSQRSAMLALSQASGQFQAKGIDSQAIVKAMQRSTTVSEVALRSLAIIAGKSAPTTSPAAAPGELKALRLKWERWLQTPTSVPSSKPPAPRNAAASRPVSAAVP
jgi:hypothetical protein